MLRSAWVVLPVSEWMVVGHKEVTLAGRAERSEPWGCREPRRVKYLNALGGGASVQSSCVRLGFLAVSQTGFSDGRMPEIWPHCLH